MPTFDEFLSALLNEIEKLARRTVREFRDAAMEDARAFLESTRADLERWTRLLAEGRLTAKDFEWLVLGKKDLAELVALKQKGLALARVDRFRKDLLGLVIRTAVGIFPGAG